MKFDDRDRLEAHVKKWVEAQEGRWKEHASDLFLTSILVQFVLLYYYESKSKVAIAYRAGCSVFETGMEQACRAGGNGHHIAQRFEEHFNDYEFEKST